MNSIFVYLCKYFGGFAQGNVRQNLVGLRFVSTALPDSWYKRLPPIDEKDIEEKAIKGSGPGGQAINKTQNCCQIKHLPTGIVVTCQQTRFLEKNRLLARRQLQEKLDLLYNGEESLVAQYRRERNEKRQAQRTETKLKLEKKRAFKSEQEPHPTTPESRTISEISFD